MRTVMRQTQSYQSNPFFNRQRITDPTFFIGREREIEALYSAIATRQCRSIVGERKIGKSSLLTHLMSAPTLQAHGFDPSKYVFLYIDLEGMANITYEEFWPELVDRLEMSLPEGVGGLKEKAGDLAMQDEVRFMQVRRLLRRIERAGLTVVMMLDEFESLAGNAAFMASFYGELRSLAGELGVVYITASKRSLYDLTYQHADTLSSPFFNIFSEEPIGLMMPEEAMSLLEQVCGVNGRSFTLEQQNYLIDLAGTHPFFLQVAAFYLYRALFSETSAEFGNDWQLAKKKVTYRFKAEAEDHFRYLWSQLTAEEQTALLRLDTLTHMQKKKLWQKALLRWVDDQAYPFSYSFADFIQRNRNVDHPPSLRSSSTTTSSTDLTGTTLGNYRVLSTIGRGGMAVVYKGYQPSLDRYVAIKVMSRMLVGEETFMERFQREAASVAQLRHQNVVQMYDFGLQNDISYMVMEFIEGETLKQRLTDFGAMRQRVPLREIVKIMQDIASAMDYAHAHGIVHRDIKPANIMLRREDRLAKLTGGVPFTGVLTDFGVARMLEGVQLTGTGATIGTPDYMSPEQARGEPAGPASDIYALGIILYEMLTGELPFTADTPVAMLLKHMQADPPSVILKAPDLPPHLEPVLIQALAKDPRNRFSTTGKLAESLAQAIGDHYL